MSQSGEFFPRIRAALAASVPRRVEPLAGQGQAAVAVILAATGSTSRILFIKRAEYAGDPWSGHLALPGGRRHPEDRDLRATAERETVEEVGISLPREALLGELDDLSPVSPHLPPIIVRPFVYGLVAEPPVFPSAEVALHLWVPRDALIAAATTEMLPLLGGLREVRGYRLGPHFIWGMTERIIMPFLRLLDDLR